jgi:hypothetical protein
LKVRGKSPSDDYYQLLLSAIPVHWIVDAKFEPGQEEEKSETRLEQEEHKSDEYSVVKQILQCNIDTRSAYKKPSQ